MRGEKPVPYHGNASGELKNEGRADGVEGAKIGQRNLKSSVKKSPWGSIVRGRRNNETLNGPDRGLEI